MDSLVAGRLRELVDNMDLAVAIYEPIQDGEDFVFADINKGVEIIEKVNREDIIGRKVTEAFPSVSEFGILEVFKRVYKTGEPERFPVARYEDERIAGWRDNYVYKLETGEVVAVYRDETERKQLEEDLQQREHMLTSLYESSPDHILLIDKDLKITYANFPSPGLTMSDLIGASILGFLPHGQVTKVQEHLHHVLATGESVTYETMYESENGSIYYESRVGPQISNEEIVGVILIARDITPRKQIELDLRSNEERYRRLFNDSAAGIIIRGTDGLIANVNKSGSAVFGFTPDEMIGMHISALWADRSKHTTTEKKLINQGKILETEIEIKRKNGEIGYIFATAQVRYDESGNPMSFETYFRDITQQKYAEIELVNREELFRGFIQSSTDMVAIFDEELRYVDVNKGWLDLAQKTREEVIGKRIKEVFPSFTQELNDIYIDIIKTGDPVFLESVPSKSNPSVMLDISLFKIGDKLGAISRDVSSRVNYQSRLDALREHALALASMESLDETVHTTFDIMREALGLPFASFQLVDGNELITLGVDGRTPSMPVMTIDGKGITTKAAREKRTILLNDVRTDPDYIGPAGQILSELAVPIIVQDEVLGVLNVENAELGAYSDDDAQMMEILAQNVGATLSRIKAAKTREEYEKEFIRQRIETEKMRELDLLKTEFMNTATHEIRTPITSIRGYTELIQDALRKEDYASALSYFDIINRNVSRLEILSNDLLSLQRLEAGRVELSPVSCSSEELFSELRAELTPLIKQKNHELVIDADREYMYFCDKARLMQVLTNLVDNAVKYSPEGSTITVTVENTPDRVQFSVRDEGVGLSKEDMDDLFQPFPHIKVEGVRHGSGLGLSICKGIVELHGGEIWAESEGRGKGSTFYFQIPMV